MIKRIALFAATILVVGSSAQALEFQAIGNGSVGLGGAGVARNYGAMAPYWNPAGLAFAKKTVSVGVVVGAGVQPNGTIANDLDSLSKTYDAWDSDQSNTENANALVNDLYKIYGETPKDNLHATAEAAVGFQIKHFGFGAYGTFEGGSYLNEAPQRTITADAASITSALADKTVTFRGIGMVEVPLSYGHEIDLHRGGKLGVGASLKYLYAEVGNRTRAIYNMEKDHIIDSSDLTDEMSKSLKTSGSFGLDLGVLYKPVSTVSLGLVGKNLNSPSFSDPTGGKLTAGRQIRAGLSYEPFSWVELTGDIDVLSNSTVIPGMSSQRLGGGAEFHPFSCLKLRVGGYTDLAVSSDGAVTAGLSLGIPWVFLDVDGAYGLGTTHFKDSSYPSEAKVQAALNIVF